MKTKKAFGKKVIDYMIKNNIKPIDFTHCTVNRKNRIVTNDEYINALRDYLLQKKRLEKMNRHKTKVTFP